MRHVTVSVIKQLNRILEAIRVELVAALIACVRIVVGIAERSAVQNRNQRDAVAFRSSNQALACSRCIAGLYADRVFIQTGHGGGQRFRRRGVDQKTVRIQQRNGARTGRRLIGFRTDDLAECLVLQRIRRQKRHIAHGRKMSVVLLAVHGDEVRMRHAERLRFFVHHRCERFRTACDMFRNRDRGIVAGGQHHAVQQIAQRIRIAFFKPHQRIAASKINRLRGDGHHVVEIAVFERDDAGKDLCCAGGEDRAIGFLFDALIGNRRIVGVYQNIVGFID